MAENKQMKARVIRAFVREHPFCTRGQIIAGTNIKREYVLAKLLVGKKKGEYVEDEDGRFTWNAIGEKLQGFRAEGRKARAVKRAGKPRVKSMRELADKIAAKPLSFGEVYVAPVLSAATHAETTARVFAESVEWGECSSATRLAWQAHTEALALLPGAVR